MNVDMQGIFQYEDEVKEKPIDRRETEDEASMVGKFSLLWHFSRRILRFDNEILYIFIQPKNKCTICFNHVLLPSG